LQKVPNRSAKIVKSAKLWKALQKVRNAKKRVKSSIIAKNQKFKDQIF